MYWASDESSAVALRAVYLHFVQFRCNEHVCRVTRVSRVSSNEFIEILASRVARVEYEITGERIIRYVVPINYARSWNNYLIRGRRHNNQPRLQNSRMQKGKEEILISRASVSTNMLIAYTRHHICMQVI